MAKKVSPASSPQSPSSPMQSANNNNNSNPVVSNAPAAAAAVNATPATTPAAKKNVSADGQKECCIMGCSNPASKRSRFSLRLYKDKDFKPDFMENNWNKVCERHYFQDLYQFKKLNKTTTVRNASKNSNSNSNELNTLGSNAKEMETEASDTNNGSSNGSAQAQPAAAIAHHHQTPNTKKEKKNASKKSASKKRDFETMSASNTNANAANAANAAAPEVDSESVVVAPSAAKKRKIWTLKEKTLLIHKIATLDEETVKRIIDVITSSCPGSCNFFHNEDTLEVDVNKFDESTFEKIQIVVGQN